MTPESLFTSLSSQLGTRKQRSLQLIHQICAEQQERNSHDFSIATIGKLSKARGGPSEQAIRNKNGDEYRQLIASWQCTNNHKKLGRTPVEQPQDVLKLINEPSVRAEVGLMLAELKQLRGEVRLLKSLNKDTIIIDKSIHLRGSSNSKVELLPAIPLSSAELHALENAISPATFENNGWQEDPKDNSVRNQHGRKVFEAGFVSAIKTVLDHTKK